MINMSKEDKSSPMKEYQLSTDNYNVYQKVGINGTLRLNEDYQIP